MEITYAVKQYWSKSEQDLLMAVGNRNQEVLKPQFRRYIAQLFVRIFDRLDAALGKTGTLPSAAAAEVVAEAFGQTIEENSEYLVSMAPKLALQEVFDPDSFQHLVLLSGLNFTRIDKTFTEKCDEIKSKDTLFTASEHKVNACLHTTLKVT